MIFMVSKTSRPSIPYAKLPFVSVSNIFLYEYEETSSGGAFWVPDLILDKEDFDIPSRSAIFCCVQPYVFVRMLIKSAQVIIGTPLMVFRPGNFVVTFWEQAGNRPVSMII